MKPISNHMMKLWTLLLECPGEPMDLVELGYHSGMTARQVCSAVNKMPSPPIVKMSGEHSGGMQVMFNGAKEDAIRTRKAVLVEYYELHPEVYDDIKAMLSTAAWLSTTDIATELNISCATANRLVAAMEDIEMMSRSSKYKGRGSIYCKLPSE